MAKLKKITFHTAPVKDGCTCNRCGQYIRNIWTVEFEEGIIMTYGIDCFEKILKTGNLTDYGRKLMKQTMKSIEAHYQAINRQAELTEETDEGWKYLQADWNKCNGWYGEKYSDYKAWMLGEFIPTQIARDQETLNKFRKADFEI